MDILFIVITRHMILYTVRLLIMGKMVFFMDTVDACPPETFSTVEGLCVMCKQCDQYSVVKRNCTRDSDTECVTCQNEEELQTLECRRCSPCKEGTFVYQPCSKSRNTVCDKCPQGSYNPKTSYSNVCTPCTSCERMGRTVLQLCTRTRDETCGNCKNGYYFDHSLFQCVPCRRCRGRFQRVIRNCKIKGRNKDCARLNLEAIYHQSIHTATDHEPADYSSITMAVPKFPQKVTTVSRVENTSTNWSFDDDLGHVTTQVFFVSLLIFIAVIAALCTGIMNLLFKMVKQHRNIKQSDMKKCEAGNNPHHQHVSNELPEKNNPFLSKSPYHCFTQPSIIINNNSKMQSFI